jgi:hypothetical protein
MMPNLVPVDYITNMLIKHYIKVLLLRVNSVSM